MKKPPGIAAMDMMMDHPVISGIFIVALYLWIGWLLYREYRKW